MKAIIVCISLGLRFGQAPAQASSPPVAEVLTKPAASPAYWKTDQIKWDQVFADGTKPAILEGPAMCRARLFRTLFSCLMACG